MRVLQLGKHYPPAIGGIERTIKVFTEELNKRGIKCDVLCANEINKYIEEIHEDFVIIRTPRIFKFASTSISPKMIIKLAEIWKNYDIIHAHMPDPMANLALYLVKPKCKLVLHWHMDIVKQKILLHFYKPLVIWLFKRADSIIVTSQKLLKESQFRKFMKNKIYVLPLPFDCDKFQNIPSDETFKKKLLKLAKGRKIILSVGRLVYYKGFDVLIKASQYLNDKIVIFIVGEGPKRKELEKLIDFYNLKTKVYLLGKLTEEELVTAYRVADLFCLPSIYKSEAFGLVQLEAMCFGLPVVSTLLPASGVSEVNLNGITGFCVPPRDEKALTDACQKILFNSELYDRMSKKAKERIKAFNKDKIISELISIYSKIL